jgi:hypothetical protein
MEDVALRVKRLEICGSGAFHLTDKFSGVPFTHTLTNGVLSVITPMDSVATSSMSYVTLGMQISNNCGDIVIGNVPDALFIRGVNLTHLINPRAVSAADLTDLREGVISKLTNAEIDDYFQSGPIVYCKESGRLDITSTNAVKTLRVADLGDIMPLAKKELGLTVGFSAITELKCEFALKEIDVKGNCVVTVAPSAMAKSFKVITRENAKISCKKNKKDRCDFENVEIVCLDKSQNKLMHNPNCSIAKLQIHALGTTPRACVSAPCREVTLKLTDSAAVTLTSQRDLATLSVATADRAAVILDNVIIPSGATLSASGRSKITGIHLTIAKAPDTVVKVANGNAKISGIIGLAK